MARVGVQLQGRASDPGPSLSLWALTVMDEHTTPGATSCSPQVSDLEFTTEVL